MPNVIGGRTLGILLALVLLAGGCAGGNLLGGREKCWPESDPRAASIWRGILRIDNTGSWLDTPEGEAIYLSPGALVTRIGADGVGELVAGDQVVAKAGDDLTLFGGAGADGALVVCAVEEKH